ncbi:hypothetical protein F5890DRAFT_1569909 [Lentinula detonsa]|uniref:Nucleolar protein 12 n=1 Tax=Lentinula detonsa TaxID=2804962 RepID=A0AA38QAP9_9AGAR|nr:hypothetical protein F5890DRAFT_1569909 [Lentinula detonsa]
MALSSFLLTSGTKKTVVDTELDSLFKNASAGPNPLPNLSSGKLKRKHQNTPSVFSTSTSKKTKLTEPNDSLKTSKQTPSEGKAKLKKNPTQVSKAAARKGHNEGPENESDGDGSELENAYLSRLARGNSKRKTFTSDNEDDSKEELEVTKGDDVEDASSNEEDEENHQPPQHETLSRNQHPKKLPKAISKYAPPDETLEQRNARTIFVGNLSVEVSQKKSLLKSLQRHILALIPSSSDSSNIKPKIESTRFRSVPFAMPTSTLEKDEDEASTRKDKSKSSSKARQHDIDRTKSWKKSSGPGEKEEEGSAKSEKKFLTPAQKKKIAFINQDIHASGSSINAYILFAHPIPTSDEVPKRKSNLPPLPDVMNPYEAARLAKEACDGSEFMERTLRVDVVAQTADSDLVEAQGRVLRTGSDVDPKRCIFVGNLDFESKEEDVRAYFEGVLSAEKGPRVGRVNEDDEEQDSDSVSDGDKGNDAKQIASKGRGRSEGWVTRVRIIRDKDTQLGKGFGYVQFAERDCVDQIIAAALEPGKLKFAKRKLRVERCKTIPGGSFKVKVKSASSSSSRPDIPASKANRSTPTMSTSLSIPKGDPNLGSKLAHLSKEERKSAKAADADRLARRLAKKKSRMAMAVGAGAGAAKVKVQGKERGRERKARSGGGTLGKQGKGHGVGSATKNKGKAISERAFKTRNVKK